MKRAIFLDIDGTLVDFERGILEVPLGVRQQITRLQAKDYYFFIATGRPKAFLLRELLKLNFDGYILCNGGCVEINDEVIFHQPLPLKPLINLVNKFKNDGVEYVLQTKHGAFIKPQFTYFIEKFAEFGIDKKDLNFEFDEDVILKETLKIEVVDPKNQIIKYIEEIKTNFAFDDYGTANFCEIYSKEISKASGIENAIKKLGISIDNTYAIGDGINDIEMLEYVGMGVAMGNAIDIVKNSANLIIGNVYENGLENYLKTLDND